MRFLTTLVAFLFPLSSIANVLGDMQTFSPNTDGLDFITVHTARPLDKDYWVFSNYLNSAKDHLLVYKTLQDQDRIDYKDSLIEYDLGFAYGLADSFQVSLQMPILLSHSTSLQEGVIVNLSEGIHSFRPGFKWNSTTASGGYLALLGSVDFPFLSNSPYTGTEDLPIGNIEAAYSWKKATRIQSLNLGGRLRNPTETPADAHMFPLKSQITLSYGLSDKYSSTARWVFEAISSYPLDHTPYNNPVDIASVDVLLGMKHRWYKNLNFDWGGTIEPGVKTLSPTYRLFAGLVYYWKPKEKSENTSNTNPLEISFLIAPENKIIKTYQPLQFFSRNEIPIESCHIIKGPGSLSEGCEFLSESPGISEIEFFDNYGRTVKRTVTIKDEVSSAPLEFTQKDWEVYAGSSLQVTAEGGRAPLQFKILKGQGKMSTEGFYEAPLRMQTVLIEAVDSKGLSATATIKVIDTPKEDKAIDLANLEFISGKPDLTPASLAYLRRNLESLRRIDIQKMIVEGHTDSIGHEDYNQKLSRLRAETVKGILSNELGLAEKNIQAIGYGESRPIANNTTAQGRQKNRRVGLKVFYKK